MRRRLADEGLALHEGCAFESVMRRGNGLAVAFKHQGGAEQVVRGSHLLVDVYGYFTGPATA